MRRRAPHNLSSVSAHEGTSRRSPYFEVLGGGGAKLKLIQARSTEHPTHPSPHPSSISTVGFGSSPVGLGKEGPNF